MDIDKPKLERDCTVHPRKRKNTVGLISLVALLLVALLVPTLLVAQISPSTAPTAFGLDGRFVELARRLPGFGGYFFDPNGDLVVYLTDLSQTSLARTALEDVARNRPPRSQQPWTRPADIVVRRGDFDFLQLNDWRGNLEAVLVPEGMQMIDTDEAANRVYIGVTDEEAERRVLAKISALGVPATAVVVEVVPPVRLIVTLQEHVRPLVGGLQINSSMGDCTLGVNVWYGNIAVGIPVGTPGFYTASHCSSTWGGNGLPPGVIGDGTVFSQGGAQVGYEMYDPRYFTHDDNSVCPLPTTLLCRWSDVTFVAYDTGIDRHQGAIAQTMYRAFGTGAAGSQQDFSASGSIEINSSQPEFTLNQTALPVVGVYLDKMGRSTGWTSGAVGRTCFGIQAAGSRWFLCQDRVDAYAYPGDSGGPVFQRTGQTTAAFSGITWSTTDIQGRTSFIFSNINSIANDMGFGVTYGPN